MSTAKKQVSSVHALLQLEETLQLSRFKHRGTYCSSINGLGEALGLSSGGVENAIVCSPIDGIQLAEFSALPEEAVNLGVQQSRDAFRGWRCLPAPQRGKLVAAIAQVVKENKEPLADLITLEVGRSSRRHWVKCKSGSIYVNLPLAYLVSYMDSPWLQSVLITA